MVPIPSIPFVRLLMQCNMAIAVMIQKDANMDSLKMVSP